MCVCFITRQQIICTLYKGWSLDYIHHSMIPLWHGLYFRTTSLFNGGFSAHENSNEDLCFFLMFLLSWFYRLVNMLSCNILFHTALFSVVFNGLITLHAVKRRLSMFIRFLSAHIMGEWFWIIIKLHLETKACFSIQGYPFSFLSNFYLSHKISFLLYSARISWVCTLTVIIHMIW